MKSRFTLCLAVVLLNDVFLLRKVDATYGQQQGPATATDFGVGPHKAIIIYQGRQYVVDANQLFAKLQKSSPGTKGQVPTLGPHPSTAPGHGTQQQPNPSLNGQGWPGWGGIKSANGQFPIPTSGPGFNGQGIKSQTHPPSPPLPPTQPSPGGWPGWPGAGGNGQTKPGVQGQQKPKCITTGNGFFPPPVGYKPIAGSPDTVVSNGRNGNWPQSAGRPIQWSYPTQQQHFPLVNGPQTSWAMTKPKQTQYSPSNFAHQVPPQGKQPTFHAPQQSFPSGYYKNPHVGHNYRPK